MKKKFQLGRYQKYSEAKSKNRAKRRIKIKLYKKAIEKKKRKKY